MPGWELVILSDVHVHTDGAINPAFAQVVRHVAARAPRLVVVSGDSTSGNHDDGVGPERVRGWWAALQEALQPLLDAGVPILPIAGNHDYYSAAHQEGYRAAWGDLLAYAAPLQV